MLCEYKMKKTNEKFISVLNNWIKNNWNGDLKELACKLSISPQHLSNITSSKRGCSEDTRINICNKLGIDYRLILENESDIISKNRPSVTNLKIINFQEKNITTDPRLKDMQENLLEIYNHGDHSLISAIEMNLVSFRKTVEMEKRISKLEKQNEKSESENLSLKEENENLKKTINKPGG